MVIYELALFVVIVEKFAREPLVALFSNFFDIGTDTFNNCRAFFLQPLAVFTVVKNLSVGLLYFFL